SKITKAPVAGNDVYLSVDHDLQIGLYHILERNIAAILISKINNGMSYGTKGEKASGIQIPIYEVYNALIYNNVIDIKAFKDEEASDLEKRILSYFEEKREIIFGKFRKLLAIDNTVTNQDAGEEMEEYLDYVYSTLISKDVGILVSTAIDRTDEVYLDYTNNKISLSQFLQYAISKNWVDLSVLNIGEEYFSTEEIYDKLIDYGMKLLDDDVDYPKMVYSDLIHQHELSGRDLCLLLFDQGD
ncbi:MAG: peptidase, partial [Lachnospiraceae bacterium]|nr:peptidase [Lachnospiraceae bacterium]